MPKPWFMYPYTVPFGNTHYDTGYYASHDLDIGAPPNYPVTNLLGGTIASITRPSWGWQVGIRLDSPYNGIPYCHFLHLSAVNPGLSVGFKVTVGTLVGWVGGANNASQYVGTNNPTGTNYVNPLSQSSQIQVGFALSHGEEYGVGAGWEDWNTTHKVDWSLDPTPIIEAARKAYMNTQQTAPFLTPEDVDILWNLATRPRMQTGLYHAYHADMLAQRWRGVPLHEEIEVVWRGTPNTPLLQTSGGFYTWEQGVAYWHPNT